MNDDETKSPTATIKINPVPEGAQDLTGRVFGKWTVLGFSHIRPKQKTRHWRRCWWVKCSCEFGGQKALDEIYLLNGESKSCGCRRADIPKTHGMSWGKNKHPIYSIWSGMRYRCRPKNDYNSTAYHDRGIYVDSAWDDFSVFVADMFPSWKPGLSLDRINNDGPYPKANCRWATRSEQMNNTRGNKIVNYRGKSLTVKQLQMAAKFPISYATVCTRLGRGWTPEETIETPLDDRASKAARTPKNYDSLKKYRPFEYIQNYV